MLKKIIPFAIAAALLVPTIASAQALTTSPASASTENAAVAGNSARAPYASQIKSERATIKADKAINQAIRTTIKGKQAQVKTLIAQAKANKTLKAKKDAITADKAVIKTDNATLKGINTSIKADWQAAETDKTNKDYANLVTDLGKIPALQTSKTPVLQKISSDLDTLISLLNN